MPGRFHKSLPLRYPSIDRIETKGDSLRLVGCLLLLSGFFLVLAALVMFPALGLRFAFVVAGLGVEVLGVGLLTRAYTAMQKERQ